jgi:hypothetical protein
MTSRDFAERALHMNIIARDPMMRAAVEQHDPKLFEGKTAAELFEPLATGKWPKWVLDENSMGDYTPREKYQKKLMLYLHWDEMFAGMFLQALLKTAVEAPNDLIEYLGMENADVIFKKLKVT